MKTFLQTKEQYQSQIEKTKKEINEYILAYFDNVYKATSSTFECKYKTFIFTDVDMPSNIVHEEFDKKIIINYFFSHKTLILIILFDEGKVIITEENDSSINEYYVTYDNVVDIVKNINEQCIDEMFKTKEK